MAKKPKSAASSADSAEEQKQKMKSRGTQDDVEVLRLVINDNRGLQVRVLDKIRLILSQSEKYGAAFQEKSKKKIQKPG